MLVASNIQALMVARNLDAAKLARRARLNPTGIYDILKGKSRSPKIETIGKIAKALGVPIAIIFSDDIDLALRSEIEQVLAQLPREQRELLLKTAKSWLPDDAA